MKAIFILSIISILCSCSTFKKSEEAIYLKVDTSSLLRGRTIDATIQIKNSERAEQLN